ncbi:cysteine--tRNA ligase [Phreatobacter sp.]|uniref:cysteine--tRNA ligase n=1 Tax=Phreatobacter sp. TaxID=1966341 RepID=UPI0022BB8E43|nr:cysteine--tRNA ligase [Phreatobacter sp.]MCZ8313576.1 cysteine--tRNA ligase [Phreatobacter sp.]
MAIRLYNTLTRSKDEFRPIDPKNVRMYVCGPTVYDDAHIGNARPVIVFDLLFRLLRHAYGEAHVTYARNITDLDDKINKRAFERGVTIRELTEGTAARFHAAIDAVGALRPTVEPRATEHIEEMKALCEKLVAAGHAYVAEDHVLFSVPSMPGYGGLSKRPLDDMIAGARVDVAPYKRSEMDFVLWKPSREAHEPGWPSPCGIAQAGRPGWHIECSAMSWRHLGETFDIHGGGIDLVFPHHENEVAQTTCAFGHQVMANVWMHNGFLQVEGEKMSKSLGNFVTIQELLDGWQGKAWPGEVLRLTMLKTHYRQPIDWTVRAMEESWKTLEGWYRAVQSVTAAAVPEGVLEALGDDLNTAKAIAELHALDKRGDYAGLKAALLLMGFDDSRLGELKAETDAEADMKDTARIDDLIAARLAARKAKNFAESDRIRDELAGMGIQLKDGKDPATGELVTTWEVMR